MTDSLKRTAMPPRRWVNPHELAEIINEPLACVIKLARAEEQAFPGHDMTHFIGNGKGNDLELLDARMVAQFITEGKLSLKPEFAAFNIGQELARPLHTEAALLRAGLAEARENGRFY